MRVPYLPRLDAATAPRVGQATSLTFSWLHPQPARRAARQPPPTRRLGPVASARTRCRPLRGHPVPLRPTRLRVQISRPCSPTAGGCRRSVGRPFRSAIGSAGSPAVACAGMPPVNVLRHRSCHQPAGGEQMRVFEQVGRARNGRERQAERLTARHQLRLSETPEDRSDPRQVARPVRDPQRLRGERGSASRSVSPNASQKPRHCVSVTTPTKTCSPGSAVSNTS